MPFCYFFNFDKTVDIPGFILLGVKHSGRKVKGTTNKILQLASQLTGAYYIWFLIINKKRRKKNMKLFINIINCVSLENLDTLTMNFNYLKFSEVKNSVFF